MSLFEMAAAAHVGNDLGELGGACDSGLHLLARLRLEAALIV